MPRRNILVLANITPGAIFLRTLTQSLADQDRVKRVCACLMSFSVIFIASLVVSLVVPLPLWVCLAFACVMFIASLVVSLVVPLPLRVCLAFACIMFIASLIVSLVVPLPLHVCLAFACVMFTLCACHFLLFASLPCVFCCGGKKGPSRIVCFWDAAMES